MMPVLAVTRLKQIQIGHNRVFAFGFGFEKQNFKIYTNGK